MLSGGPTTVGGTGVYSGLASYVWQGLTLGVSVAAVGDTNSDGFNDIAFSRGIESLNDGSVFIIGGSPSYQTFPGSITNTNLPGPGGTVDGMRNILFGSD